MYLYLALLFNIRFFVRLLNNRAEEKIIIKNNHFQETDTISCQQSISDGVLYRFDTVI